MTDIRVTSVYIRDTQLIILLLLSLFFIFIFFLSLISPITTSLFQKLQPCRDYVQHSVLCARHTGNICLHPGHTANYPTSSLLLLCLHPFLSSSFPITISLFQGLQPSGDGVQQSVQRERPAGHTRLHADRQLGPISPPPLLLIFTFFIINILNHHITVPGTSTVWRRRAAVSTT